MSEVKLMVLYPQPTDAGKFDSDYRDHIKLFREKTGIPDSERPYTVTRFAPTPQGAAPFYQLFSMGFPSEEALQKVMASPQMKEVAADANRISSGGPPLIMVGSDA